MIKVSSFPAGAGNLRADKADSRPAGPSTVAEGECLVWGEHSSDTGFPP